MRRRMPEWHRARGHWGRAPRHFFQLSGVSMTAPVAPRTFGRREGIGGQVGVHFLLENFYGIVYYNDAPGSFGRPARGPCYEAIEPWGTSI